MHNIDLVASEICKDTLLKEEPMKPPFVVKLFYDLNCNKPYVSINGKTQMLHSITFSSPADNGRKPKSTTFKLRSERNRNLIPQPSVSGLLWFERWDNTNKFSAKRHYTHCQITHRNKFHTYAISAVDQCDTHDSSVSFMLHFWPGYTPASLQGEIKWIKY